MSWRRLTKTETILALSLVALGSSMSLNVVVIVMTIQSCSP